MRKEQGRKEKGGEGKETGKEGQEEKRGKGIGGEEMGKGGMGKGGQGTEGFILWVEKRRKCKPKFWVCVPTPLPIMTKFGVSG